MKQRMTDVQIRAALAEATQYRSAGNVMLARLIEEQIAGELTGGAPVLPEHVGEAEFEYKVQLLDRALAGAPGGYPGLRLAYEDITGQYDFPGVTEWALSSVLRESVSTTSPTSWAAVLAAAADRRVVAEYNTVPGLQAWRRIASTIRERINFRQQSSYLIGGYGVTMPVVNEGAPYQPFTTPPMASPATYTANKRGGSTSFTYESMANDDLSLWRREIAGLGRAAATTLHRAVFDLLTTNPTIFDGTALFHATHGNLLSLPLSSANFTTARNAMRAQTASTGEVLGLVPKYLVVAPALEESALEIVELYRRRPGEDEALRQPVDVIVVDHWTSSTGWYLVADPRSCETIEIGFTGTVEPRVVISTTDPTGAGFSTDKIFAALKHGWGLAVVDYRGLLQGSA